MQPEKLAEVRQRFASNVLAPAFHRWAESAGLPADLPVRFEWRDGPTDIRANAAPPEFRICGAGERAEIEAAAAGEDGKPKLRRFNMVAYTGGLMRLQGWYLPVVVDLAGAKVLSENRPVLRSHDPERLVGHTDSVKITATQIKAAGVISGVGE